MKKTAVLIAGLLVTSLASAQWWGNEKVKGNGNVVTKERNVGSYDEVSVAGSFDVELVYGTEGKLTITAEENLIEYIETEVEGDNLKIKPQKGYNLSPSNNKKILIIVPFESISKVALAGSGDVVSKNTIKATDFTAALAGSGDLVLTVESTNLEGKVAGSGDLKLSGKTNNFECSLAGSGDVHAYEMKAQNVEVSIAGSGDIRVFCDGGTLKARVSGSGDVHYQGNPDKIDSKVAGSGDVSKG